MTERAPLITLDADACRHCWRCAYRCPARAIRVSATGPIEIIEEKCVRCGLCVTECPQSAWVVRDDGAAVDALLAGPRPVVALLATEPTPGSDVQLVASRLASNWPPSNSCSNV